jgi:acyl-CoA dehydrogenase
VARDLLDDKELRLHLTSDIYVPEKGELGLGKLEETLDLVVAAQDVQKKVRDAARVRRFDDLPRDKLADEALAQSVITQDEYERLAVADKARDEAIQVDAFDPETYKTLK